MDLSIEMTEAEMLELKAKTEFVAKPTNPGFVIGNPVSIRPSQFPMNGTVNDIRCDETIAKDDVQAVERSLKEFQLSPTKDGIVATKTQDASLIVVEDTEDLSAVCRSEANRTRRETVHSPFKIVSQQIPS